MMEGLSASATGLRFNNDLVTGVAAATVSADLGLDAALGFPLGLNEAAKGLGRNSLLFGFKRAA